MLASTLDEYSRLLSPSFPSIPSTWLLQPDVGAQEPDATVDDDSYYTGGAYYYVQAADDDHEQLGGSQAGGLRLFQSVSQFVLAILWKLV